MTTGTAISALSAATSLEDADLIPIYQASSNANRSVTKSQMAASISQYKTVSTSKYTAAMPGSLQIAMSDTSDFVVGLPVRWTISGTSYYGIVATVTSNTQITLHGASNSGTITALAVGDASMVKEIYINIPSVGTFSATILADNNVYRRWNQKRSFCVKYSAAHSSANSPSFTLKIAGANVSSGALTLSSTPGTWASVTSMLSSAYDIDVDDSLEMTGSGTTPNLNWHVQIVFVPE